MRKLFKGGNYSRAETICGNTVFVFEFEINLKHGNKGKGNAIKIFKNMNPDVSRQDHDNI